LVLSSLVSNFVSGVAYAAEADAKQEKIRAEMGKPFAEIQTLLTEKKYPEALEKLKSLMRLKIKHPTKFSLSCVCAQ